MLVFPQIVDPGGYLPAAFDRIWTRSPRRPQMHQWFEVDYWDLHKVSHSIFGEPPSGPGRAGVYRGPSGLPLAVDWESTKRQCDK